MPLPVDEILAAILREPQSAAFWRAVSASTGQPPPMIPFPAEITGLARPRFPYQGRISASILLADPYPPCTDLPAIYDCETDDIPDADGFYPPVDLPCGVWPARYSWRSDATGLSSDGCGLFKTAAGVWRTWRHGLYAMNEQEMFIDPKLDYPFVRPGTPVIMGFGPIPAQAMANPTDAETMGWGFFFSHHVDPKGTQACAGSQCIPEGGGEGCCQVWIGNIDCIPIQLLNEFCQAGATCLQQTTCIPGAGGAIGIFLGFQAPCPDDGIGHDGSCADPNVCGCCYYNANSPGGVHQECSTRGLCDALFDLGWVDQFVECGVCAEATNPGDPCCISEEAGGAQPAGNPVMIDEGAIGRRRYVTPHHKVGGCGTGLL